MPGEARPASVLVRVLLLFDQNESSDSQSMPPDVVAGADLAGRTHRASAMMLWYQFIASTVVLPDGVVAPHSTGAVLGNPRLGVLGCLRA